MQNGQQLKDFLLSGDYSSVESFIRLYEDSLYGLCRRLVQKSQDADDLYQQTWLKAIQKAHGYKQKSFKNWLYTICINTYRDQYRKSKYREKFTVDTMDESAKEYMLTSATDGVSAESVVIGNEAKAQLALKIDMLPEKHRLPIVLHYFEGMDYNECARMLNVPVGTIKSRLNSAKKKLLEEMERNQID